MFRNDPWSVCDDAARFCCVGRLLLVAVTGAVAVMIAGCGGGAKNAVAPITPRQVERTFSRSGIQLTDTMLYTNRDRPIIRSYDIPGQGTKMNGVVFVYDSVQDAARTEPKYRKVYGRRGYIAHANVIAQFDRDTTKAARRQITRAMTVLQ